MAAETFQRFHGFQRGFPVAGHSQIIAVDVNRMWQAKFSGRLSHATDNLTGSDIEVVDRLIQTADVSRLMRLPDFDTTRVHQFGGKPFG